MLAQQSNHRDTFSQNLFINVFLQQDKRRAEIEEKLEQAAVKEKEAIYQQRKELYEQRRSQRQLIGFLTDQVELAATVSSPYMYFSSENQMFWIIFNSTLALFKMLTI